MHLEVAGVSGANQYSVRPLALVSTVDTADRRGLQGNPGAASGRRLRARVGFATPSRARAATETAPTPAITIDTAACTRASIRAPG